MVVACYVVPLLWSWWQRVYPNDMVPNDARIAAFVLRGRRGRVGDAAVLELGATSSRQTMFSSTDRLRSDMAPASHDLAASAV